MLLMMRERNADERATKMNRMQERIDAENRARLERVVNAMSATHTSIVDRLIRAPPHLRSLLATFLRPGFTQAFLLYAKRAASADAIHCTLEEALPFATSVSEPDVITCAASAADLSSVSAAAMADRGLSMEHSMPLPQPSTGGPVASEDTEERRYVAFSSGSSAGGESNTSSGRKRGSGATTSSRRSSVRTDKHNRHSTNWRVHDDSKGVDLTLTVDTAAGSVPIVPAQANGVTTAEADSRGEIDQLRSSTAAPPVETKDTRVPQHHEERETELVEHEVGALLGLNPALFFPVVTFTMSNVEGTGRS